MVSDHCLQYFLADLCNKMEIFPDLLESINNNNFLYKPTLEHIISLTFDIFIEEYSGGDRPARRQG